ncbi:helix-turn-helix domain-containing protein [Arcanobacterium phocisimile]|uniref:Helix-turn-helix domain-containing protein n=1 Tax=Arcanobacterium phocisimile TaxID=1302235 RepID=A0ABX7IGB0_9ACTO|nr:helix-turn-helix domain-containing protein [Arcanobacterium phocisimile]QRV02149.1 helix-turn-helix domain-containing protein [Arcanobacterium phocisimile]
MGRTQIEPNAYVEDVLLIIGNNVRIARANNQWTQAELAQRAHCSTRTIASIEAGSPTTAIAIVLRVLQVLRIPIFGEELPQKIAEMRARSGEHVALLPERIRRVEPINVDF